MKVRVGFVSNSSSSSYIVEVPKGFAVTGKDLTSPSMLEELGESELIDEDFDETTDPMPQKAIDRVNELLGQLASGHTLYRGSWNNPIEVFWGLVELLEKNNLVVMTTDGPGGDGEDVIEPFKDQRKKK
jgi:hypothetical protein